MSGCDRLVVDLRGHLGGGISGLRLISHLTPDRPRRRAEQGFRKEDLPRFDRIPRSKWELPLLTLRFVRREQPVAVWTEGLGPKRFHGRMAVLTDETTESASQMVAAFAQENRLMTLVGQPTPGRLVGGRSFPVGHGYLVAIPVGAYYTWGGRSFEGQGLQPDVSVQWPPPDASALDAQLRTATSVLSSA